MNNRAVLSRKGTPRAIRDLDHMTTHSAITLLKGDSAERGDLLTFTLYRLGYFGKIDLVGGGRRKVAPVCSPFICGPLATKLGMTVV